MWRTQCNPLLAFRLLASRPGRADFCLKPPSLWCLFHQLQEKDMLPVSIPAAPSLTLPHPTGSLSRQTQCATTLPSPPAPRPPWWGLPLHQPALCPSVFSAGQQDHVLFCPNLSMSPSSESLQWPQGHHGLATLSPAAHPFSSAFLKALLWLFPLLNTLLYTCLGFPPLLQCHLPGRPTRHSLPPVPIAPTPIDHLLAYCYSC